MKIFIIHAHYQHRGGEDVVVDQEIDLLRKENEVAVFFTQNHKGIKGAIQTFLSPFNFFIAKKIIQKISDFQPDVIHIHNTHYSIGPYIVRALSKLNIPIVMTLHNYRLICPSAILAHHNKIYLKSLKEDFPWSAVKDKVHNDSLMKTFWLAWTYWLHKKWKTWSLVDQFLVFSEFAKSNFLKSNIGIPTEKFTIKYNSVDDMNAKILYKSNQFLYLGRLSPEKGILSLLESVVHTDIQLKIAGDGPLLDKVLEIIKDSNNIQYLGKIEKDQIVEEIQTSTALILPSVCYEGMPLSVLESFSLSNAAIVSDLGVLKDIVIENYTGFRFDPIRPESIRNTLRKWISLPENEKNRIRENARVEFVNKYTHEKNMIQLSNIYQSLIKKNHSQ